MWHPYYRFGNGTAVPVDPTILGRQGLGGDDVPRVETYEKRKKYEVKESLENKLSATMRSIYNEKDSSDTEIFEKIDAPVVVAKKLSVAVTIDASAVSRALVGKPAFANIEVNHNPTFVFVNRLGDLDDDEEDLLMLL
jgi:hypothetical protein